MTLYEYIQKLNTRYKSGISKEHAYRVDLETLIRSLVKGVEITNEPANVTDCGNPDYVITKGKIPIGYIEAKDIGKDLNSKQYKEQFTRYKKALDNLIITDYVWFQFFQNGEKVHEIKIGEINNNTITPQEVNFIEFENLICNFCTFIGQTIKSSKKLAEMMAAKARLLQNILENAVTSDEETQENTSLKGQYESFKHILIHNLQTKEFADIYAQTLAYGMFAARLNDPTLEDFSRQEAAELIPKTNPFLRKLFQYVAGYDIDNRIKTTVDNLAEVFRATNVDALLHNFGKSTQTNDPIIHFYETFLSEYDPKLRKSRGVWYTPQPVVNFIVRAVDNILKTEFGLTQGLADTSKTKIKIKDVTKATADLRSKTKIIEREEEVHRVQILDPATGTATFLAETIKNIYKGFKGQQGIWSNYVESNLIPRLNGFELLMASYSIAHLKLDMLFAETGFKATKNQRFKIYLTNSLEEHHPDTGTLFANWLSTEANEANHVKRDTPVMCIIGNPPYSGISSNRNNWINKLVDEYKYIDGKHFNERKHWLNDDYVKFIRYGQYFIEKNGSGILAYINPHGFLDNPTFRGMRWNLLKAFDKIYTIDLHGNSNKKETAPDGSADFNVFDIMQGVSINIFIKTNKKKDKELSKVFHFELFGKREFKYDFLIKNAINDITFQELNPIEPYYFFVPKTNYGLTEYEKGFKVDELFSAYNVGFVSANDELNISMTAEEQKTKINDILTLDESSWRLKYKRQKDAQSWKYNWAKSDAEKNKENNLTPVNFRPFDIRWSLYTGNSGGLYARPSQQILKHFLEGENIGLVIPKINKEDNCFFISNKIIAHKLCSAYDSNSIFPLYIYPKTKEQLKISNPDQKHHNLNIEIVKKISDKIGLPFTQNNESSFDSFAPIDILDYIYAIFHSPKYRKKYNEFLKIDFPRIPYPRNQETFWRFAGLGKELRKIHLMESPKLNNFITQYPINGNNVVSKITKIPIDNQHQDTNLLKAFINDTQYFYNVPKIAWEFYIGGYQPAQKWLKDRKGRELNFEDIQHYQKIIIALTETHRLMEEIDKIEFE